MPFVDKEAFEIRPEKGYLWLQCAAFWLLRKIGTFRTGMDVKFTQHRIDERDFIARIYKSKRAVVDQMAHDPGTLLIGADDWRELMGGERIQSMYKFSSSIDWHDRNGPRVIGMRVVIVPWMTGILPIPDSLVGRK